MMENTQGVGDTDSTIHLRVIDNVSTPSDDVTKTKEWFPRKRSLGDKEDKLVKRLKTVDKNETSNENRINSENELVGSKIKQVANNKYLRNQGRESNELKSLTIIRTRADIEESIREAASMTHGQIQSNSRHINEKLMSFWHYSINECLACEQSPAKYFTKAKWNHHIKVIHGLNRTNYVQKYGNPDLTQFKHSCYLCGKEVLQLYTVIKKHLETLHDGMSIEFYTREFRDLIVQERAKQPVLFNQRALLEGWSDGCIYSCYLCSTPFHSTSTLENHLSVVHKNVDLKTYTMPTPTLTRYHKCYICGKKLRQEHKIIYRHLHKCHQLDINKYTNQFQDYVRMELTVKGMNYIMEEEVLLAKRPSLASYLNKINLEKQISQQNGDKVIKDWANYCDYKCFCEEIFGSYLKLHLHISRKHEYKNMAQYRVEHGEPSVLHRLHKCKLCRNNIKWEASRIRDHLKKQHKDKNFTLQTYAQTFRQEILSDIQKLKIESKKEEAQVPFRFGKVRLGGDKVEYTQEEWKQLTNKKVDPNSWVSCPTCAWEMKQASLYRHLNNVHPNVIQKLKQDLREGKSIDSKWKNIEVDINGSDDTPEEVMKSDVVEVNATSALTIQEDNEKEESDKHDISFVRIDPETGEIMITDSLPYAKQELECVLTETKDSAKILYFCDSDTTVNSDLTAENANPELTAANNNSELTAENTNLEFTAANTNPELAAANTNSELTAAHTNPDLKAANTNSELIAANSNSDLTAENTNPELAAANTNSELTTANNNSELIAANTKDLEDSSDEEEGFLTGRIVVVEPSDGTDEELDDQSESTAGTIQVTNVDNAPPSNQASFKGHEEYDYAIDDDEDLTDTVDNKDCVRYEFEQTIHLSADCRAYVATKPKISNNKSLDDDLNSFDDNIQACIAIGNVQVDEGNEEEANTNTSKVDLSPERNMDETKRENIIDDSFTATDKITTKDVSCNESINNMNDKSFQSIIMGSDGNSIQRIAVIHRKGDVSSRLDRSFLLNHISSLINNMDSTESSNLKIIEIEVEADDCVDKTAALLANSVVRKASKRKSGVKSGGVISGNSYGFSIKTISQPTEVQDNYVSRGTQASKWTKMGGELQKIANHKIVEVRRQTSVSMESTGLVDKDIAGKLEFTGSNGVAQCSIGVQVIWENRARGTVDLDEEEAARDRITAWINTNASQVQNCKKCPGCFKEFTRKRNLLQHLQSKHGVQLTGDLGLAFQMYMETENATVCCPDCSILLSKKSLRRHQRQIHKH